MGITKANGLDPAWGFMATRAVVVNGVQYQIGDPVDTSNLSFRRVRQMMDNRQIAPYAGVRVAVDEGGIERDRGAPQPQAKPVDEAPTQPQEADSSKAVTVAVSAEHRGFGRYTIRRVDTGEVVAEGVYKADADLMVARGVEVAAA